MSGVGRKRCINYEEVVRFTNTHPDLSMSDIATHFATTRGWVRHILTSAGVTRNIKRGRPIERTRSQTDEQFYWEQVLHRAGLGMDAGLRIHNKRILYGYDPALEVRCDRSATQ
jgi:hypothetical protein